MDPCAERMVLTGVMGATLEHLHTSLFSHLLIPGGHGDAGKALMSGALSSWNLAFTGGMGALNVSLGAVLLCQPHLSLQSPARMQAWKRGAHRRLFE